MGTTRNGRLINDGSINYGRGGWEILYLFDSGFSYQPLGSSTRPPGLSPPTLKTISPEEAAGQRAIFAQFGPSGFGDEDDDEPPPQNTYDPRADFRDYAVQLSNDNTQTDCLKLALLIYKAGQVWIGSGTPNQQMYNDDKFVSGLLNGLTEFAKVTDAFNGRPTSDPQYRVGVFRTPRDPYYASGFRDTGFAPQFQHGTNEVRHFVAFLAAGHDLGIPGGIYALAVHEGTLDSKNPGVALGEKAVDLGGNFFGDYKRLAQDVWHQVCGQSSNLNLP